MSAGPIFYVKPLFAVATSFNVKAVRAASELRDLLRAVRFKLKGQVRLLSQLSLHQVVE